MGSAVRPCVISSSLAHYPQLSHAVRIRSVDIKHNQTSAGFRREIFLKRTYGRWKATCRVGGRTCGWLRERASLQTRGVSVCASASTQESQLPDTVTSLPNIKKLSMRHSQNEGDVTEVFVIGTAHVSQTSCQQVRELGHVRLAV